MKTATVSELKMSLSDYLKRVRAGEEVLVKDRGRPVARLVPVDPAGRSVPAHLLDLEKAGLVRIGTGRVPKEYWELDLPEDPGGGGLRALIEEREESR